MIRLCQLYSDILSTYGDRGNILYLEYWFQALGIPCQTVCHQYQQPIPEADVYVFGGGQDSAQRLVAQDFLGEAGERLRRFLPDHFCLAICGGYQLLGHYYIPNNGPILMGLKYLPIGTVAGSERLVGPVAITRQFGRQRRTIVGFENHSGRTVYLEPAEPLGRILAGGGNNDVDGTEGIIYQKIIGTYLHGPILPRNPHLIYWWLKPLVSKYRRYQTLDLRTERWAHREQLKRALAR
jgi:CobQ-like glutamine amidotransferase family enzyme